MFTPDHRFVTVPVPYSAIAIGQADGGFQLIFHAQYGEHVRKWLKDLGESVERELSRPNFVPVNPALPPPPSPAATEILSKIQQQATVPVVAVVPAPETDSQSSAAANRPPLGAPMSQAERFAAMQAMATVKPSPPPEQTTTSVDVKPQEQTQEQIARQSAILEQLKTSTQETKDNQNG